MKAPKPAPWPADKVERWPIDDLIPSARNTRTHSDEQVRQIAASIEQFGWTIPVLCDEDGELIAGHGRILAAHLLGITEVPVMVARGWTEAQKRAYRIADNKLAENAGWDMDLLRIELADLQAGGFEMPVIGFTEADLNDLLSGPKEAQAPAELKVKLADRFGIPPFSILNAREGWWQDRKRAWLALGIESELGRGDTGASTPYGGEGAAADLGALRERRARAKANAVPGGAPMPLDRKKQGNANAEPGGSKMPAANYSKNKAHGDGRGRAVS